MTEIDESNESKAIAAAIILLSDKEGLPSSSSSSTNHLSSGPAIDRHNPIITDSRRIGRFTPPCTPMPSPISPQPPTKPSQVNQKKKKKKKKKHEKSSQKKAVAETTDGKRSWSCNKTAGDFISPAASSSRYLLSEPVGSIDLEPVLKLVPAEQPKTLLAIQSEGSSGSKDPKPSSSCSHDQMVVLRVSLHCRGCERKMKKHLSRMKGVTSFNIDFAAKKVTVVGDVTPLEVLTSISKVKNAQLWPTPPLPSSFLPKGLLTGH